MLPLEVNVQSLHVVKQNMLIMDMYEQALLDELHEVNEDWLAELNSIQLNKWKVEGA